jgi:hypothetical protein
MAVSEVERQKLHQLHVMAILQRSVWATQGGAHGGVRDLKAGASAPPLFGLRHFPVELAGPRSAFVARLRRGKFFVCTSGSFFWPPEPSRSAKWASTYPLLKNSPYGAKVLEPQIRWGFTPGPLVYPSLFWALPAVRHPWGH